MIRTYIDHFLQAEIISKLAAADRPLRFSELKEDGIENSLFMYHANKLITRGLVGKSEGGFNLTVKGARWANYTGDFHDFMAAPRPLVQFVIQNSEGQVLLAIRKGQLRQLLNDYLLPGNLYRYGVPLEENVTLILQELFGDAPLPEAALLTTADIIHEFEDGFVHHVISYIFAISLPDAVQYALQSRPLFDTTWIPLPQITTGNPQFERSAFLPIFFERMPLLRPHETFVVRSK
jgi:hypothetical protein